jgi:hypothetical protein
MRAEIAKGVPRNVAIKSALKRGATLQAIADEVGVTKQRVQQISVENGFFCRKRIT